MSTPKKYWEKESPAVLELPAPNGKRKCVRWFRQAGVLQFQDWIDSPQYTGPAKGGVSIYLLDLAPDMRDQLLSFVAQAVDAAAVSAATLTFHPEPQTPGKGVE